MVFGKYLDKKPSPKASGCFVPGKRGLVQTVNCFIVIIVLLLLLLLSLLVFYFHQTVNVRFAPNGKQKKQKKKKSWFMCKPDPKVFSKNKVQYDSPLI